MSTSIAKLQAVNQSLQKRVSSALGRAKNAKDEATGKISAGEAVAWGTAGTLAAAAGSAYLGDSSDMMLLILSGVSAAYGATVSDPRAVLFAHGAVQPRIYEMAKSMLTQQPQAQQPQVQQPQLQAPPMQQPVPQQAIDPQFAAAGG